MSWNEYDPKIIEAWKIQRDKYLNESKAIRIIGYLLVFIFPLVFMHIGVFPIKIIIWLISFGVLLFIDNTMVKENLKCPNCNLVPYMYGGKVVGSSNPERCCHCGTILREP
jgi:uncharacterized membrane protein